MQVRRISKLGNYFFIIPPTDIYCFTVSCVWVFLYNTINNTINAVTSRIQVMITFFRCVNYVTLGLITGLGLGLRVGVGVT
jgi:hypothetical protein